jgi:hypothetical protein
VCVGYWQRPQITSVMTCGLSFGRMRVTGEQPENQPSDTEKIVGA